MDCRWRYLLEHIDILARARVSPELLIHFADDLRVIAFTIQAAPGETLSSDYGRMIEDRVEHHVQ
jgi:hypothetical protein